MRALRKENKMNKIEKMSKNYDTISIIKELRKVQSQKSRLKKQKFKSNYETEMTKLLLKEEDLKQVRELLNPKVKKTTEFTKDDIGILDYNETLKCLNNIHSKKSLSRWLTEEEGQNEEFKNAERIEKMLLEHKKLVQPVDEQNVRKTDVQKVIVQIKENKLTNQKIIEMLESLL